MTAATYELVQDGVSATDDPSPTATNDSHILVVDDTDLSRRSAALLIERGLGRKVRFAENGRAALEDIARIQPALVLTDLQMPVMNGLELVEEIRKSFPHIPVVLMTAFGTAEIAMRALKLGAASYVGKSELTRSLTETIDQVLTLVTNDQKRREIAGCQTAKETQYTFGNDADLIAPLITLIQQDLIDFRIGDDTVRTRVAVALQESLANAIYHGNLECSSDLRQEDERVFYRLAENRRHIAPYSNRKVHVRSSINNQRAMFTITDEGPGFDISSLDKPCDPEDLLRIGGRGMLLIRTFMDEVRHNALGNQISMIKNAK